MVNVHLFARARDLAGTAVVQLDLSDGATVGDVRKQLALRFPALGPLLQRSALAVNNEFADDSQAVVAGAEIALLPPVSGG